MLAFNPPCLSFDLEGVKQSALATGGDFPSPLANDLLSLANRARYEWLWVLLELPSVGVVSVTDLGALRITGLPDGVHVVTYRGFAISDFPEDPTQVYDATITINVTGGIYTFSKTAVTISTAIGALAWTYTAPVAGVYPFQLSGLAQTLEVGSLSWAYTAPEPVVVPFTLAPMSVVTTVAPIFFDYQPGQPSVTPLELSPVNSPIVVGALNWEYERPKALGVGPYVHLLLRAIQPPQ